MSGLQKNVASQKWRVFAFNRTTNEPVTGDAANITAKIRKNWGAATATNDVNPTEVEDGYYDFDLAQAESNANWLDLFPESVTADIQVIGVPGSMGTVPVNFQATVIEADGMVHADVKEVDGTPAEPAAVIDANLIQWNGDVPGDLVDTDKVPASLQHKDPTIGLNGQEMLDVGAAIDTALVEFLITHEGFAQAGGNFTITLASGASGQDDLYLGQLIYLRSNTGAGQANVITAYNGTSRVATVARQWAVNPAVNTVYEIRQVGHALAVLTSQQVIDIVVAIEAELADDATGEAIKQAIIDKMLENLPDIDDLTLSAIANAARDAVLNRILSGNHDTNGTVGKLLQSITEARLAELDAANLPADVAAVKTDTAALTTALASLVTTVGAAGAGLTDLGGMSIGMKSQVKAEILDGLNVDAYALPGQATPSDTPTIVAAIMQMFQQATNPTDQDDESQQIYNRAGDTVHQKRTLGVVDGVVTLGALVTGP